MSNTAAADPLTVSGIAIITMSAVLEFLDVHSGAIVSLCSLVGAICAIIGVIRAARKDDEWLDDAAKEPKKKKWFRRKRKF